MFELKDYLADLTEICAMDTGRGNRAGREEIVGWFRTRFEALGFRTEVRITPGHEEAPVLLVSNCDPAESFDVLFISHLDTVFDTETVENWPVTVDEAGICRGPGVVDCKGGSLLVYYLLREMKAAGELGYRFVAAMNSDEEGGSLCSRCFFEELAENTGYCLVFEPGRANDEFVGVRKGGAKYRIIAHGVGAHSGADFEKGANAIVELAKWVPELTGLIDLEAGTTLNVAKFEGGLNNGQVPDRAELIARLLYLDPAAIDRMDALIRRMESEPFDPRCSLEVREEDFRRPPMYMTENSEKLFHCLEEAGRKTGCPTAWISTGGMSDGNWVAHHGVATLDGCGPCGAGLHTRGEYLKTQSVEPRIKVMRTLLNSLFTR